MTLRREEFLYGGVQAERPKLRTDVGVVVPWINHEQKEEFLKAWRLEGDEHYLYLQHDVSKEGCAVTKNKGIQRAVDAGAEYIIVLDDDCFPAATGTANMNRFIYDHLRALEPQRVLSVFATVTEPPSRGTPYTGTDLVMPVAASMGFWTHVGDYDAPRQLAHYGQDMVHFPRTVYGEFFPLCGMNLAFHKSQWPWYQFIDVPRYDDIWQGWLWQKYAYANGYCFNLNGPKVKHSRQSNVWKNLKVEAEYAEQSEQLWQDIALAPQFESYEHALTFLPEHHGGSDR